MAATRSFVSDAGRAKLVPAVDRAVAILRLFRNGQQGYGVSELSRALNLNKSTTHDILATLCHHGFLERDAATKRYRLGWGLLELGHMVGERLTLRGVARPLLEELGRRTGETVFLGAFVGRRVLLIDKEESPYDMKITSPLGRRLPATAGAFGKVFLAALPWRELDRFLSKEVRRFTARTVTDPKQIKKELGEVRRRGYATDDEEYLEGVRAAGAPIVDSRHLVVGAISCVGLKARLGAGALEALGVKVREACRAISRRLGASRYPAWDGLGGPV